MPVRVAINGFGRIGRLVLRAAMEAGRDDLQFVAINDLGAPAAHARLLKRDSIHGPFPGAVAALGDALEVDGRRIAVLAERDPAALPWAALAIDVAMECTGLFASKDKAAAHLRAGAAKVLVSAPAAGADATVVHGVNHEALRREHKVVSNASCTTNCLAPVAAVLHRAVGIRHGFMTTVHAFTGDQRAVDSLHGDPRRARAASLSMIPSSTGAARAVGLVLPELAGRLDGTSIRVPVANVSLIDLTFEAENDTTAEAIGDAMREAAAGWLQGVLAVTDEPLVSTDFNHNPASATFDLSETKVTDGRFVRVLAWYDNEWGFSNRMSDTAAILGTLL